MDLLGLTNIVIIMIN